MRPGDPGYALAQRMSPVGVGTARGPEDEATDRAMTETLTTALGHGATVVDTAVNYRSGRSERAVGVALRTAVRSGLTTRERVVVVSKAGYPRPEDGGSEHAGPERHPPGGHCLKPACIRHSLHTSLATLDVDFLDVCLLHNLETLATDAAPGLHATIEVLEEAVAGGFLGGYGFSTWTPAEVGSAADPMRFLEIAGEVAGPTPHFTCVQAPLSLLSRRSLLPRFAAHGESLSLPTLCSRLGVVFVASAAAGGGRSPSLAAASVRWTAAVPGVTTALVGTVNREHLLAALGPGGWEQAG